MAEPSDTALGEPTMAKPNITKPTAMATNIDNKPSLPLPGEPQEPGQSVPQESDQSLLPTTEPKKPLPRTRKNMHGASRTSWHVYWVRTCRKRRSSAAKS
jgi:hypothetical protein